MAFVGDRSGRYCSFRWQSWAVPVPRPSALWPPARPTAGGGGPPTWSGASLGPPTGSSRGGHAVPPAPLLPVPAIASILIWISVAYTLCLAPHIATAPPLSEPTAASSTFSVAGGTFLGIANPKAWVAIATVFASGHLADDTATDAAAKIAVLTAMIIAICAIWLVAGTSIAPLLRDPGRARVVNAALAVALVGATALAVLH